MFKRKIYEKLKEWKNEYAGSYSCLIEGARRVGKSTVAEEFAKNEYESYIKVDFANISEELLDVFRDITDLNLFFLRLQAQTGITLIARKSVIIFDEIQLYPKARQAIKYLVKDGRYDYIETGSLISIKKNVRNIIIPSEEHKISMYPMDYEEFLWATGGNPDIIRMIYDQKRPAGDATNRKMMRNFRIYMAVGGMPQAVEAYISGKNFEQIDHVKREIIQLYIDDLKKIDPSGRLGNIYQSVPSQLALKKNQFSLSAATGKRKTPKDEERLFDLIDARIVLPCYHVTQPGLLLSQTAEMDKLKLYLSDTGLFTTMLFQSGKGIENDIYNKMLSDQLSANLGYLYENIVAQSLSSAGKELYYHTWQKDHSTHSYEIDFLTIGKKKVVPIEVKSSATRNHESIDEFSRKYSKYTGRRILLSQKDFSHKESLELIPLYTAEFLIRDL